MLPSSAPRPPDPVVCGPGSTSSSACPSPAGSTGIPAAAPTPANAASASGCPPSSSVASSSPSPSPGLAQDSGPQYTDDDLFFGTVPVLLRQTGGGSCFAFDDAQVLTVEAHPRTRRVAELARRSAARLHPLRALGADYSTTVIPALPALDFVVADRKLMRRQAARTLPSALRRPMIKIPSRERREDKVQKQEQLEGVASGVRSALVRTQDGSWYRLKGCGNNDQGFVFSVVRPDHWNVSLRGAAFPHTTLRELKLSAQLDRLLEPLGLECANKPVGWWEYELGPQAPLPLIKRCCVILRTLGDRRLGDHVLNGLEQLLPLLIPPATARILEQRLGDPSFFGEGWVRNTWMAALEVSLENSSGRGFVDCTSLPSVLYSAACAASVSAAAASASTSASASASVSASHGQHNHGHDQNYNRQQPADEDSASASASAAASSSLGAASSLAAPSASVSDSGAPVPSPPPSGRSLADSRSDSHVSLASLVSSRSATEEDPASASSALPPHPHPQLQSHPSQQQQQQQQQPHGKLFESMPETLEKLYSVHTELLQQLYTKNDVINGKQRHGPQASSFASISPKFAALWQENSRRLNTFFQQAAANAAHANNNHANYNNHNNHHSSYNGHGASRPLSATSPSFSASSASLSSLGMRPSDASDHIPAPSPLTTPAASASELSLQQPGYGNGVFNGVAANGVSNGLSSAASNGGMGETPGSNPAEPPPRRAPRPSLAPQAQPPTPLSMLLYLYWRLGRELGVLQRTLRQHRILWGTYTDPMGQHCNAHANNAILLQELSTRQRQQLQREKSQQQQQQQSSQQQQNSSAGLQSPVSLAEESKAESDSASLSQDAASASASAPSAAEDPASFACPGEQLPTPEQCVYLSPLDLDMAFSESQFVDLQSEKVDQAALESVLARPDEESGDEDSDSDEERPEGSVDALGNPSAASTPVSCAAEQEIARRLASQKFAELAELEWNGMKLSLAGFPDLSSGVSRVPSLPHSSYRAVRTALRDTLCSGFMSGIRGEPDRHPPQPRLYSASYALLRLALVVTADVIP